MGGGVSGAGGSRNTTPSSYQDLANRPRSNPRTRTPMRTNMNSLNLSSVRDNEDEYEPEAQDVAPMGGGVAMRAVGLGAGLAVGTVLRRDALSTLRQMNHRRQERTTSSQPLSHKQGPSHRKLRRWNNDKFVGIASEISHANSNKHHTTKISNILRIYTSPDMEHGFYDGHGGNGNMMNPYAMPYNETRDNNKCTALETLLLNGKTQKYPTKDDSAMADGTQKALDPHMIQKVKERFLDGEVGKDASSQPTQKSLQRKALREDAIFADGNSMLETKVQERLRKVVKRACESSDFSKKVLRTLEQCVVHHLSKDNDAKSLQYDESILNQILIQKPLVTNKSCEDGSTKTTVRFLFDTNETKGTFHRLLLTAVCHFHGLVANPSDGPRNSRILTVTGVCRGCQFQLLDYLLSSPSSSSSSSTASLNATNASISEIDRDSPTNLMHGMATLKVS